MKTIHEENGWKVQIGIAWIPVLIRNRFPGIGRYIGDNKWTWLRRHTRVLRYNERTKRFRTFNTYLGYPDAEQLKQMEK